MGEAETVAPFLEGRPPLSLAPRPRRGRPARRPRAIDLFSGPGGLSRGLVQVGFDVVAACEMDDLAVGTFRDNFPHTLMWHGDVRRLSSSRMRRELAAKGVRRGELELLAGCPPCEGFSRIRTHNGARAVDDPRNDLIREFGRAVETLLPHFVLLENVPALRDDERFREMLSLLEKLGYEHNGGVIKNVADYGVPQSRRRLVLLAARRRVATMPPEPTAIESPESVQSAIGDLPPPQPDTPQDELHDYSEKRSKIVLDRIRQVPHDGGGRSDLPTDLVLPCHTRSDGFRDVYGRMAWGKPSPTITGGCVNPSKGRFLHPEQDRAITLREAARLQSFPDDHRFRMDGGKYRAAEMIGNALPPRFVAAHAKGIVDALRKGRVPAR